MKKLIAIIFLIYILTSPVLAQWPYQQKPMLGQQINWAHPLSDFVGFWLMNEGSGNKVFDLSGNGNNLVTFASGVTWQAGKYGPSLDFPGVTHYVQGPIPSQIVDGGDITMIIWFTPDAPNGDQFLLSIGDCALALNNLPGVRWWADTGGGSPPEVGATLVAGQTYCLAVTHTGIRSNLYLDAVNIQQADSVALDASDAAVKTLFGALNTTGTWDYNGKISHACLWDRVLSASDVALLCREPFCMFATDDIALMAEGVAPAPPGGQVIMITSLPMIFMAVYLYRKNVKEFG